MAFTNVYDQTFPPDTQAANQLGVDLRAFRVDVQQRMAAISGLDAAKPNFINDAQPASWNGVLFFAIDTGKIYQWNNPAWTEVTLSIKIPGLAYASDSNSLNAAVALTTMLVPVVAGFYRFSHYLNIVTPAGTTSTMGPVTLAYTDGGNNVAESWPVPSVSPVNGQWTSTGTSGNSTIGNQFAGYFVFYAKAGVAIQYSIAYASNPASAMVYEAHIRLESM